MYFLSNRNPHKNKPLRSSFGILRTRGLCVVTLDALCCFGAKTVKISCLFVGGEVNESFQFYYNGISKQLFYLKF